MTTDRIQAVTPLAVSIFTLGIFLAAMVIAWWTNNKSLDLLLGAAAANATTVVSFWLGSSSSSRAKDATIAQITGPAPAQNVTTMGTTR